MAVRTAVELMISRPLGIVIMEKMSAEDSVDEELLEEVPADEMPEQDVDGEEQEDASEIEVKPAEDPLVQMLV